MNLEYIRYTGPEGKLRPAWKIIDEINQLDEFNLRIMWDIMQIAGRIAWKEDLSYPKDRETITDAITRAGMQETAIYAKAYYTIPPAPGVLVNPDTGETMGTGEDMETENREMETGEGNLITGRFSAF